MDASELIDKLGGTAKVAELCEVSSQAVSQWRTDGIPKPRMMYLRAIRPDLFSAEAEAARPDHRRTLRRVTDIAAPADPVAGAAVRALKHQGAA